MAHYTECIDTDCCLDRWAIDGTEKLEAVFQLGAIGHSDVQFEGVHSKGNVLNAKEMCIGGP
jgi:hypothetical protein